LPEPYNNLAVLYAQQKQYDKARTALEMAIRTHPSYAIAYENLGDVYAKLASQAYDKALQLDSANSATQNKMALIRDLITTSGKGNVKPTMPPTNVPAAVATANKPATGTAAPTASIVASTPGAASSAPKAVEPKLAAPVAASAPAGTAADDISKAIAAWASAWSRKDVKGYLAQYASDFKTPKGISRKAWEEEREDRIAGKPGKISVSFDEPQISINGDRATAKFRQHYKSSGLSGSTNKTLVFVRSGNRWLIQEENAR
jgi:ketosteroid isomerase-like protein